MTGQLDVTTTGSEPRVTSGEAKLTGGEDGRAGDDHRPDAWARVRDLTPARIGLGRHGAAQPTSSKLSFAAAHAAARDAVHSGESGDFSEPSNGGDAGRLDSSGTESGLSFLADAPLVRSRAGNRPEYLRRPDLGRLPNGEDLSKLPTREAGWDVGIVMADGLSPNALSYHGKATEEALRDAVHRICPELSIAPTVKANQARVALGDHIAHAMNMRVVVVIIGERPGLSVPHSLGMYITYDASPGTTDERRNCISNIHPPDGLSYEHAAFTAADLISKMLELRKSGATVKATRHAISN